jgi:glycosyltransferase involved in cell wall biosynthesis
VRVAASTVPAETTARRPRFTVISAVHNVARYLPDFIDSLDRQTIDPSHLEVIAVDDGSTDNSLDVLRSWEARRPDVVRVLTKPNGGQGSARNLGLDHARGEWVTFPDPDDWLEHDYFEVVARFLDTHRDVDMVAANLILYNEGGNGVSDSHPLRARFEPGDHLVHLEQQPNYFTGSAPAAFMRRDRVEELGLRFDTRIRPNWEDGHLCARYLLARADPTIGFLRSARYYYRKRGDQSSTLQNSVSQIGRYTAVVEHGYLDALRRAAAAHGRPPAWLQNLVLYDLSYYFSEEEKIAAGSAIAGNVGETFVGLLRQITELLDDRIIQAFNVRPMREVWKEVLLNGLTDEPWHPRRAMIMGWDETKRLAQVIYRFKGDEPRLEYRDRGDRVEPEFTKIRPVTYFGVHLLTERISWVPVDQAISVRVDGDLTELARPAGQPMWAMSTAEMQRRFGRRLTNLPGGLAPLRRAIVQKDRRRAVLETKRALVRQRDRAIARAAKADPLASQFRDAWVLMDRVHDANDSAEVLFRYLRTHRPDINAWFVLERDTPDWHRLVRDGFGDRLLEYGSLRWTAAMVNAAHVASSHADQPVYAPPKLTRMPRPWRFTFLQHGVIKDDLSNWLNPRKLDLFVTSTPDEHRSIAGDGSPYVFTEKEVAMTGLPRFDALQAVRDRRGDARPDLVVLAPTWRNWLLKPLATGSQRREARDDFAHSEFAASWRGLLADARLHKLAAGADLEVVFLPHPNLIPSLDLLGVPDGCRVLDFADPDLHEVFVRARCLVTDYSSMAFNAAYVERPTVYFQFDRQRVLSGGHVGRAGYFDYERDGFGPVAFDIDGVIAALGDVLAEDEIPEPYRSRIADTFPFRDGRCCERVVAAMEEMDRPR